MSTLHVRHIRSALESSFRELIDTSDVTSRDSDAKEKALLTRSLAAFPITSYTGATSAEVALSVVDGSDDNGLDLIHYDHGQERLYLVQSKWRDDGHGSPSVADIQKFLQGIRDLLNLRFDRFNSKIQSRQKEITAALDNPRLTIEGLFVHTGAHEQSTQASNLYDDLTDATNDGGDLLSLRTLNQSDLHALVSGEIEGVGIDLDVALFDWGQVTEPYLAFYGQVAASDIASWYGQHGSGLFARNLRKFIRDSEVNYTISDSLRTQPECFWYLNNGITVLCQSIQRKAIGGTDRKHGQFSCQGVSIVNGAQTVGSNGEARSTVDDSESANADGRVLVRMISLENCPQSFASDVTRATNTQNRIVSRDFVALDEEQERLRVELRIEGKTYALKTGDPDPDPSEGCSVVEATVALGCAEADVSWSVQVKREIGRIWEDTSGVLYRRLFNRGTTSTKVWRAVTILRIVDEELRRCQRANEGRKYQMAVHGNRLIQHVVFQRLPSSVLTDGEAPVDESSIRKDARQVFEAMYQAVEERYESNYLASLFKNLTKCKDVVERLQVT